MAQSTLRLGTRGSTLARVQAAMVAALLAARGIACEIVEVKTSGDRIQDKTLADAGGKGLFTKELEEVLLSGAIDFAVHSMKDVPAALPRGLAIAAVLKREDPADAFLSNAYPSLAALPRGARVGTSSVRRTALVRRARPDIETVLLRGNVDTRLSKLDAGQYHAILLALAGLKRLGLAARATQILSCDSWLPALAQGAIGIEMRTDDAATRAALSPLNDANTEIALACERAFQAALDGSCRTSMGGLAAVADGVLSFRGEVLAPDGSGFEEIDFKVPLGNDAAAEAACAGREAGLALKPRVSHWLA